MIIRNEQITTFKHAALENFDQGEAERRKESFPKHCESMGDDALLKMIRLGRERASGYGLKSVRSVRVYLDLMFMLGSHFDNDPQLPWAARVLGAKEPRNEEKRLEVLKTKAGEYLNCTCGPGNSKLRSALVKLRQEKTEGLARSGQPFEAYMPRRLWALYPEKAAAAGEEVLREICHRAAALARTTGLACESGVIVLAAMMFLLGAGFATDPQFGWAASILESKVPPAPAEKAVKLHQAAMTYLDRFVPQS